MQWPSVVFVTGEFIWGDDVTEIPEYSFLGFVDDDARPTLCPEHTEYRWCDCEEASCMLEWESNRAALREAERRKI